MATNLKIDDNLLKSALKLSGKKTKREAVTAALEEYVRHRKQQRVLDLFGAIEYDKDFDYKKQRSRS